MANLDWLVVADQVITESASFWNAPDMNPSEIDTTVFYLPCALIYEKPGIILNSGRWIQYRYQAVEPWDQAKPDYEMCDLLWTAICDLYKKEGGANPDPILKTKWDYYCLLYTSPWAVPVELTPGFLLILAAVIAVGTCAAYMLYLQGINDCGPDVYKRQSLASSPTLRCRNRRCTIACAVSSNWPLSWRIRIGNR